MSRRSPEGAARRERVAAHGRPRSRVLATVAAWLVHGAAAAQVAPDPGGWDHKLTLGRYSLSTGQHAFDLNWRASLGEHTGWLAQYDQGDGVRQSRIGYEWRHAPLSVLRTVWSLQAASGGARIGSMGAEVGGDTFAILGFGRTNRHPYVNLNYDPNDMVTLGAGTRAWPGLEASLFQVRDDRLGTGQRVTHLVLRWRPVAGRRWTLDAWAKSGQLEDGSFGRGPGLSLAYDHDNAFVRLARDRHAGFGVADQTRVSMGLRF